MPIIKSAKKKLRKDIKKTKRNSVYKNQLQKQIKEVKKNQNKNDLAKMVKEAYSKIDKAAKKKIIHKNTASRLKSQVAKLVAKSK